MDVFMGVPHVFACLPEGNISSSPCVAPSDVGAFVRDVSMEPSMSRDACDLKILGHP